jgi:shikimate kinase
MKHLALVGLMGAGKSTVGRECASRLARPFVDTDEVIVDTSPYTSIDEIFAAGGEQLFRKHERVVVADVCASPEPLVIACGGGAVLDRENRRALRASSVVVWLRAPVAELVRRCGDGATRPLLRGDPAAALARLDRLRAPAYEAAAHRTVETAGLDRAAVAEVVLAEFEGASA